MNSVNYTGITNSLERRIWEHKNSYNSESFTARYNLYKLVYFEEFSDANLAIKREKQIKGLSRQKKFNLIKKTNPDLNDLAKDWVN
jgi:putative endonuclease